MEKRIVPEAFHPGEYVREEADERGWSSSDLAEILGYKRNEISDVLNGRRSISPEMAKALGDAFGTGPQVWLNLQAAYRLAISVKKDDAVIRRAKLFEKAPIREMQKRGWLEGSTNVDVLEAQVCQFLEVSDINDEVQFTHAARKSTDYREKPNASQLSWLMRAKKLAQTLKVRNRYSSRNFDSMMRELGVLRLEPESVHEIPRLLMKYGIRFLIVEHLPKTKIDGACFWLNKYSPVVVLSLRYDRIDWFWHTLCHELSHLKQNELEKSPLLETKIVGDDAQPDDQKPPQEKQADRFAIKFLVDQGELHHFIKRHDSMFSKKDIMGFARRIGIHPGIIVGQLHRRGTIPYSHFRPMLVKIRNIITVSTLTDGWSRTVLL